MVSIKTGILTCNSRYLAEPGMGTYLCKLYSLEDGMSVELKVIPRRDIISGKMKLYRNQHNLYWAAEKLWEERAKAEEVRHTFAA
jgi:hypothetical protein